MMQPARSSHALLVILGQTGLMVTVLRDELGENWGHFFVAPTRFRSIIGELHTLKAMGEVPAVCALP